jgi:2-polyprenyl-3-methyl-5-hydroxy-6-metoxy-1,4-benzoquinol methylase
MKKSTAADDRLVTEQAFHDRQAVERAKSFVDPTNYQFSDDDYLDHETWIRPAFAKFGRLQGKKALDFGCGHGMAAVVLARSGAEVYAFDLSPAYVREAQERALANNVRVQLRVANAEELPYPDAMFDIIWGNAILHHLPIPTVAAEIKRVMAPGAIAVFCEPWGGNPILNWARSRLPYPGKQRTPDELPLTISSVRELSKCFQDYRIEYYQFFGMIRRLCPASRWRGLWDAIDHRIIQPVPLIKQWCRYAVLTLNK